MKYIVYYLPQFHEIKENNEWWGDGFTEWTNVKKAKKLYSSHDQPRVPLNNNYYSLDNMQTAIEQAELAEKYGIYGFAYYHYWFKGKKLLEKPIERLLIRKDILKKFCLFWANHDWKRSWNGSSEILIKQEYGGIENWIEHFEYFKDFFIDDRYIKFNNKPVLIIFKAFDIPNFDEMINLWNQMSKEIGFDGIYIIESLFSTKDNSVRENTDGIVLREPDITLKSLNSHTYLIRKIMRFLNEYFSIAYVWKLSYKKIVEKSLLNSQIIYDNFETRKDIYLSVFTGWDNTPRHGKRGFIIESNFNDFESYLIKIKEFAENKKIDYVFINAWNEWAEGMYLEPDEKNNYKYLEVLKKVNDEPL